MCTTRSRTVGIPSGRNVPSGLGSMTRRTGWARSVLACRSRTNSRSNMSTPIPLSMAAKLSPSLPGLPRLARTSRQA